MEQGILERCSSRDKDAGDFHSDSVQQAVAKSFKGKVYTKEHALRSSAETLEKSR